MLLLEKAANIFASKEDKVEKFVESEAVYYFSKSEKIADKLSKQFCNGLICATIGDAYDFYYYAEASNNVFSRNIDQLDKISGRKLYKWFSIYHGAAMANLNPDPLKMKPVLLALSEVFKWSRYDKKMFAEFFELCKLSHSEFIVAFAKKMTSDIFCFENSTPISLALTTNLLYNSHNSFIKMCEFERIDLAL